MKEEKKEEKINCSQSHGPWRDTTLHSEMSFILENGLYNSLLVVYFEAG